MELLHLHIKALAPLVFPTRKPGAQFRKSLEYVPGTAIYGALGKWLGDQKRFDSELFRQIRCHNAYPAYADDTWVRPLPATAIQPKGSDDKGLLYDSLIKRVCWERQQPAALIYAPTDAQGRPWEAAGSKFYTLNGAPFRQVYQRTITRVAINRRRGTAEDQRLYSFLALNEVTHNQLAQYQPTQFRGSLVYPIGQQAELTAALGEITHLGGRQTTGMGRVKIQPIQPDEQAQPVDDWQEICERVGKLTDRFRSQVDLYCDLGGTPWRDDAGHELEIADQSIFTINLLSDAILLEHGWVPTIAISADMLTELTGIKARPLRAFTTTSMVSGWNVSWQRPKASDVAVNMGGVFVFQADHTLEQADFEKLAQLQLDGIGERRAEGFGQVRICDQFHLLAAEE